MISSIVSFHHLNYLEGIFFYYWDTGGGHHEGSYLFSLIAEEAFTRIRKLVIVYFGWQIVQIMAPSKIDLGGMTCSCQDLSVTVRKVTPLFVNIFALNFKLCNFWASSAVHTNVYVVFDTIISERPSMIT